MTARIEAGDCLVVEKDSHMNAPDNQDGQGGGLFRALIELLKDPDVRQSLERLAPLIAVVTVVWLLA